MGIKERKEREKKNRRRAIIKAAKRGIKKQGAEGMSMNQLAEMTELNKATLYLYFKSKDDLVDAIVLEGLAILDKELGQADRQWPSGLETVSGLIRTTFDFYKKYPIYFNVMNHQERRKLAERLATPHSIEGDKIAGGIFEKYRQALKRGLEDGSIRPEIDMDRILVLIYAQTYGVMHTVHTKEDVYKDVLNMNPQAVEQSALEFMNYYLKK
jgi:AcrR family transcriptional regulator